MFPWRNVPLSSDAVSGYSSWQIKLDTLISFIYAMFSLVSCLFVFQDNKIVEQQVMAARSAKQSSESSSSYSDDKLKIEKIQSVLKAQNNTLQSTKSDFIHFGTEATQKIQHLEQWYTKSGVSFKEHYSNII